MSCLTEGKPSHGWTPAATCSNHTARHWPSRDLNPGEVVAGPSGLSAARGLACPGPWTRLGAGGQQFLHVTVISPTWAPGALPAQTLPTSAPNNLNNEATVIVTARALHSPSGPARSWEEGRGGRGPGPPRLSIGTVQGSGVPETQVASPPLSAGVGETSCPASLGPASPWRSGG